MNEAEYAEALERATLEIKTRDEIIGRLWRGHQADLARYQWSFVSNDSAGVRRHFREDMSPKVRDYFEEWLHPDAHFGKLWGTVTNSKIAPGKVEQWPTA